MNGWEEFLNKEELTDDEKKIVCNSLMTTETRMERLILKHFSTEDFREIWEKRIGDGLIGGKACGLLVARKLIKVRLPEFRGFIESHHSFFIGSDVFCQYLEQNGCTELREKHRKEKEHFTEADELRKRLKNGVFSEKVSQELKRMLKHYGTTPIIVRSSSFLEDGYGNAFSGKYESIFCMNQGSEEERIQELEEAIRQVYASTMHPSAIEYRRKRKLLDADEQMALLVQKVEGEHCDDFYFPVAAGMGCSYNPYKWMEHMNPDEGMLRIVVGLGTRAVERTPGDYPRLVGLDRARANLRGTIAEQHKFSQRQVDVLDFSENKLTTKPLEIVIQKMPEWQKKLVLSRDTEAEYMLSQRRRFRKVYFADCQGLVEKNDFIWMMRKMLKMLEGEYERPVDVEFAVKCPREGMWKVNLLQCRPLQVSVSENVVIPGGIDDELLFDVRRTSMRRSKRESLDKIVWVDPQAYYEYPYAKKPDVGRMISQINQHYEEEDKRLMLLVPGRIGTSSPELGVPVVYADISQFIAICEVAYSKAGYRPELSYGSHMFQDLVEADVYYGAINENSKTRLYQPELLRRFPDVFLKLWAKEEELSGIIKVFDVESSGTCLYLDAKEGRAVCRLGKR